MLHVLAQQDPGELQKGLTAIGRGIVYGGAAIGPGIGIGLVVAVSAMQLAMAREPESSRRGAHHDVLGHRVHRGPRSVRLRPRVHHLGLGGLRAHRKLLVAVLIVGLGIFALAGSASAAT